VFRRHAKVILILALAALGLFGLTQMASGTYVPTLNSTITTTAANGFANRLDDLASQVLT